MSDNQLPGEEKAWCSSVIFLLGFLCLILLLKLAAISNAIRWLNNHGAEYWRRITSRSQVPAASREDVLDACHAGFFPFGLKEYRLVRSVREISPHSVAGIALRWPLIIFHRVLFQFQVLALAGSFLLVLTASAPDSLTLAPRKLYGNAGAIFGLLLMAGVLLLAAESYISYAVLGSYGTAFHRLYLRRQGPRGTAAEVARDMITKHKHPVVAEMSAYAGLLITAYAITAATSYFVSMQLGGFQLLGEKAGPGLLEPDRLFDSFYWTLMLAAGSGGAGPETVMAKLITMIAVVAALLLLVIVLAGLAGITITPPPAPRRPIRHKRSRRRADPLWLRAQRQPRTRQPQPRAGPVRRTAPTTARRHIKPAWRGTRPRLPPASPATVRLSASRVAARQRARRGSSVDTPPRRTADP